MREFPNCFVEITVNRFPLERAKEAHQTFEDGKTPGKVGLTV